MQHKILKHASTTATVKELHTTKLLLMYYYRNLQWLELQFWRETAKKVHTSPEQMFASKAGNASYQKLQCYMS